MAKIKKVYQKNFTTVDNTVLNDETVSWKAKGLFTYLWSKPDNWNYSVKEVSKHAKDGRDSTSDGVQELEDHGYLKREQVNEKGSFGSSVWTLAERPIFKKQSKKEDQETPKLDLPTTGKPMTGNPSTDLPMTEKSSTENPALLNTDIPNTDNTNKRITKGGSGTHAPTHEDVYNRWIKDWGFPNSIVRQDLDEWIAQFGPTVVIYTIEYALTKDVASRSADPFLTRVFDGYLKKGVKNVKDAKQANAEHDNRVERERGQYRRKSTPQVREDKPDWMTHPYKAPDPKLFDYPDDSQEVMPDD